MFLPIFFSFLTSALAKTYRISNSEYTGWKPAVTVQVYSDSDCTTNITSSVDVGGCSGSWDYLPGHSCETAFETGKHWRPQCHPCEPGEVFVEFDTEEPVHCVVASNLGKGHGGGKSWSGGISVNGAPGPVNDNKWVRPETNAPTYTPSRSPTIYPTLEAGSKNRGKKCLIEALMSKDAMNFEACAIFSEAEQCRSDLLACRQSVARTPIHVSMGSQTTIVAPVNFHDLRRLVKVEFGDEVEVNHYYEYEVTATAQNGKEVTQRMKVRSDQELETLYAISRTLGVMIAVDVA